MLASIDRDLKKGLSSAIAQKDQRKLREMQGSTSREDLSQALYSIIEDIKGGVNDINRNSLEAAYKNISNIIILFMNIDQEIALSLIDIRSNVFQGESAYIDHRRLKEFGASELMFVAINHGFDSIVFSNFIADYKNILERLLERGEYIDLNKMQSHVHVITGKTFYDNSKMISKYYFERVEPFLSEFNKKLDMPIRLHSLSNTCLLSLCQKLLTSLRDKFKPHALNEEELFKEYYDSTILPFSKTSPILNEELRANYLEFKNTTIIFLDANTGAIKIDARLAWKDHYPLWITQIKHEGNWGSRVIESPSQEQINATRLV
jgi:hypothetical protein